MNAESSRVVGLDGNPLDTSPSSTDIKAKDSSWPRNLGVKAASNVKYSQDEVKKVLNYIGLEGSLFEDCSTIIRSTDYTPTYKDFWSASTSRWRGKEKNAEHTPEVKYNGLEGDLENMKSMHLNFSDKFQIFASISGLIIAIAALMFSYFDAKFESQEAKIKSAVIAVESVAQDIRRDMSLQDGEMKIYRDDMKQMRKDIDHHAQIEGLERQLLEERMKNSR